MEKLQNRSRCHRVMLNLAQVQKNPNSGNIELQILAHQIDDRTWEVDCAATILPVEENTLLEGTLVLFDKESDDIISSIQPAKDWILNLLQNHLSRNAINPQLIAAEQIKIEKWRQEITIQNLELNRKVLELETRREQLQELEQSLKQERKKLEDLHGEFSKEAQSKE